jgi:hypothetical protein
MKYIVTGLLGWPLVFILYEAIVVWAYIAMTIIIFSLMSFFWKLEWGTWNFFKVDAP